MRTVACVLSYRMPEVTDRTVAHLAAAGWTLGSDLFVVENQPESAGDRSMHVTHFTGRNLRMTGGWNWIADEIREVHLADRVWFCTNDFEIAQGRPSPELLADLPEEVGWWHPSLEFIDGYAYPWMFQEFARHVANPGCLRDVKMTDAICPALTRKCMAALRAGNRGFVFDPEFMRGWGIDYDSCIAIRKLGKRVVVDDAVRIRHEASKTYTSGSGPESVERFYSEAHAEMIRRMIVKHGNDWYQKVMS